MEPRRIGFDCGAWTRHSAVATAVGGTPCVRQCRGAGNFDTASAGYSVGALGRAFWFAASSARGRHERGRHGGVGGTGSRCLADAFGCAARIHGQMATIDTAPCALTSGAGSISSWQRFASTQH